MTDHFPYLFNNSKWQLLIKQPYLWIALLFCFVVACKPNTPKTFEAAMINDSTMVSIRIGDKNELVCTVNDSVTSTWPLDYPVYQYQFGDIDGNGTKDLAVGVLKATRYDSVKQNRLFLFQIRNSSIIPLWLGSSVGHPIVDFKMLQDTEGKDFIRIIGKEKTGKYLVADYEWYGFGLSMTGYIKRETSIEIAKELLYTHI